MIDLQNQMFEDIQKNSAVIGNNMKIDIDKDIFGFYTLCIGLLLGKILLMSIVTEKNRFANHLCAESENSKLGPEEDNGDDNVNVERTRRVHQNDVENTFLFVFISTLYIVAVRPSYFVAKCCLGGFTISRIIQTFAYRFQIVKRVCWVSGTVINLFMVISIVYSSF